MEIDPVILQLRAEVDKYLGDVRRATKTVDQQLGIQDRKVRDLEAQMRKSSGAIGASMKGLAATFATAFTGRELIGLIDGFTRLQNSLKVAGLEGNNLAAVQSRLLDLSSKYGVSIESLAGLFGNASQAGRDLGVSQEQLLGLTEATSQALLITGTSATQASGAILGLQQALAGGIVRAEEFNQINEGGLRPLLQAAAASEQFGGSVSKLREAVLEGEVSSRQFFDAILAGSSQLEGQASQATLTIAGAFEALNSQLTVYVGTAAAANGASTAIAAGIKALADNLDLAANALAVIGAALLGRYIGPMVAARVNTVATSAAVATYTGAVTLATRQVGVLAGAQVALTGAMAGTRVAAAGLLAVLGGPVGLAVTALALGLGYLATRTQEATQASTAYTRVQQESQVASQSAADAADRLATATGRAREEALAAAKALREETKQKLAGAQASLLLAEAEAVQAREFAKRTRASGGLAAADPRVAQAGGRRLADAAAARSGTADANIKAAEGSVIALQGALSKINAAIAAAPSVSAVATGGGTKGRSGRSSSGPTLSQSDINSAARDVAESGKSVTDALRRLNDITQGQFELASAGNQNEQDLLRASLSLAETRQERADIERRLITLQYSQERAEQELVLATLGSSDVARDIAKARLAVLDSLEAQARTESALANQSPGQQFLRGIELSGKNIDDQFEGVAVNGLQNLNDQLVDAIFNAESLGDVFKNVAKSIIADLLRIAIQQAIIKPLAENLFGGSGGGGGGSFAQTLGSIFGRASGGYVAPGQVVGINEGASPGRVEGFVGPSTGGNIVPLGRMDAARAGTQAGGTVRIVIEEREGFASQVQSIAEGVSVEVVRASAGAIVDAGASEALRRSSRGRM